MKMLEDLKKGMKINGYEIVDTITIKTKPCMTRINHKTEWITKTFADTMVKYNGYSQKVWGRIYIGKNGEYTINIES